MLTIYQNEHKSQEVALQIIHNSCFCSLFQCQPGGFGLINMLLMLYYTIHNDDIKQSIFIAMVIQGLNYTRFNHFKRSVKNNPLFVFTLGHAILFILVFSYLGQVGSAHGYYQSFAVNVLNGEIPYRDFVFEYPPLVLLPILLPAIIAPEALYSFFFTLQIFSGSLIILYILNRFSVQIQINRWQCLTIYTVCLCALAPLVTVRFDLLPALFLLGSILAFFLAKNKLAWVLLALGASMKLYPLLIAPIYAIFLFRQRLYRRLIWGLIVFCLVGIMINLPGVLLSPEGFGQFIMYHLERGLHSESLFGSILLTGHLMGLTSIEGTFSFASWNLDSPIADILSKLSGFITGGALLICYVLYAVKIWRRHLITYGRDIIDPVSAGLILNFSFIAILILLLFSKILSPEYLVWLCPLIPLLFIKHRFIPVLIFLITGALTLYIYPYNYDLFQLMVPHTIIMIFVRNTLLLALTLVVAGGIDTINRSGVRNAPLILHKPSEMYK